MPTLPIGDVQTPSLLDWVKKTFLKEDPRYAGMWDEVINPKGNLDPGGNPFTSFSNALPTLTRKLSDTMNEASAFPGPMALTLSQDDIGKVIMQFGKMAKAIRNRVLPVRSADIVQDEADEIAMYAYDILTDTSKFNSTDEVLAAAEKRMEDATKNISQRYGHEFSIAPSESRTAEETMDALSEGEEALRRGPTKATELVGPEAEVSSMGITTDLAAGKGFVLPKNIRPGSRAYQIYNKFITQGKPLTQVVAESANQPGKRGSYAVKEAYYGHAKPALENILGTELPKRPWQALAASQIPPQDIASAVREVVDKAAKGPALETMKYLVRDASENSPVMKFLLEGKQLGNLMRTMGVPSAVRDPARAANYGKALETLTDRTFKILMERFPDKAQYLARPKLVLGGKAFIKKGP